MSRKVFLAGLVMALGLLPLSEASASQITYDGATFSLTVTGSCGTNCYVMDYTVNFAGFTDGSTSSFFSGIAFKPSKAPTSESLVSLNGGSVGHWTSQLNTLNSNGCSSTGGAGWVCAQTTSPFLATTGTDDFKFDVTFGSAITDPTAGASFKMQFWSTDGTDESGKFVTLMSCQAGVVDTAGGCNGGSTSVPEPATLGLLGLGLAGLGFIRRRKVV